MSKAFASVNRAKLFEYLEKILQPDELHLLSVVTNTPRIYVKFGNGLGTADSQLFVTLLVIIQGSYLSAALLIFYLVRMYKHQDQTKICRCDNLCHQR